jgi:tRNA (cytidine/uridine-2'-O-)-methyltransferase
MRLCLYQPEIPQNTGTLLRLAACVGAGLDIVGPCGFVLSDRKLRRSGMDYMDQVDAKIYSSWESFLAEKSQGRLISLVPKGPISYIDFNFLPDDILVLGQEGAGLPQAVIDQTDYQVRIPMQPGCRSLNVAIAGAMVLGEALRQTQQFGRA